MRSLEFDPSAFEDLAWWIERKRRPKRGNNLGIYSFIHNYLPLLIFVEVIRVNETKESLVESDIYSKEKRSELMSRVRSKNTKPEMKVRSWLHNKGFRYKLHCKDLPGYPDLVLPKYRTAIFVHGCFWHQHPGCKKATMPKKNREFWKQKLLRNVEHHQKVLHELKTQGWVVITLWECELNHNLEVVMEATKQSLLAAR